MPAASPSSITLGGVVMLYTLALEAIPWMSNSDLSSALGLYGFFASGKKACTNLTTTLRTMSLTEKSNAINDKNEGLKIVPNRKKAAGIRIKFLGTKHEKIATYRSIFSESCDFL